MSLMCNPSDTSILQIQIVSRRESLYCNRGPFLGMSVVPLACESRMTYLVKFIVFNYIKKNVMSSRFINYEVIV